MFKKSITLKLTAGFVIIVFISMLAIGTFFIEMFRGYTFKSRENLMLSRARAISEVITENAVGNGQIRGFGGFTRFLDTLSEAKVWITDKEGNPAVLTGMGMSMGMSMSQEHYYNSEPLPKEAEKAIQEVLSGHESVSRSFSSLYDEETLTIGTPIYDTDKQIIGSVFLHSPVTGITSTLNKAISILLVSLLIALILSAGMGIFYSMLFTRPLKAMSRSALEMSGGNYASRTGIMRKDELGQLSNSLDTLASKLGTTINELYQEKNKISDIISSISEGLVAFNLDLKPLSQNKALSDVMNRPLLYPEELLTDDFNKLGILEKLKEVMETKESSQIIANWQDKRLKFIISPVLDKTRTVTGCAALIQDISEDERLEQLRRDFVANVSHEFRTPLTVIKGSLEALIDGAVNEEEDISRFHNRMLSETRSLERLVGDLLELSRLQSGKIRINKEILPLPSLVSDAVRTMQTIADKKSIRIAYTPTQDTIPVLGDYDRLRQLLIIFLDNAVKYSPAETNVTVEISAVKNTNIIIRDEGYGISREDLPYIWDRFYKSDKSRGTGGTGLGLAIAKHLIELHNGEVTLESEPGKGTIVKVSLPKYLEGML